MRRPRGFPGRHCGRTIGDDAPEDEPKYKQPPNFRKELELFNRHRVKGEDDEPLLVVVESFFSVVKLHELGYRCVSPMGRSLSQAQIVILHEGGEKELIHLFDGDNLGRNAIKKVGRDLLTSDFTVVAPVVVEEIKPHRAEEQFLHALISG